MKIHRGIVIASIMAAFLSYSNIYAANEYSLEDLYRIALEQSERIKISEEDLYIAERGKDKAVSVLFPKLSAFGSYTRYDKDKFSSTGAVIQPE
ncbi:MAG: TolC family protein, partial [Nitrospirae bacterium]|nr:TolC family protein [Nitrospirota bacterium]